MTAWASDDLSKIGAAEELEIASLRRDGTLRHPVTIWVVRHGDDLYNPICERTYSLLVSWHAGAP